MDKKKSADIYISEHQILSDRYRHRYHVMPPVGWMNDPNGFCYANGSYQFFYQFHPYAAAWGPMHWGHYASDDLIKWTLKPTALAPDMPYDKDGCFSGSAIEKDGKLYLMYTAVNGALQMQAVAKSWDGVNFEKCGLVIDERDLPADASVTNFRDPKVFERNGRYYALIGSKNKNGLGQILLYHSRDLMRWQYVGCSWTTHGDEQMCECPDYMTLGGKDVLFSSIQFLHRKEWRNENVHTARYMTGRLDLQTGFYRVDDEDEIDSGFDFYAPQTLQTPDGRMVMTAWMQMWDRTYVTAQDGWVGAAILPRELSLKDGKLIQNPVRELEKYRTNPVKAENVVLNGEISLDGVKGNCIELVAEFDLGTAMRVGINLFQGGNNKTSVYYDRLTKLVVFDRSEMGVLISGSTRERDALIRSCGIKRKENHITLRCLLDVSSLEVFINGGERTMTGLVYTNAENDGVSFFATEGTATLVSLEKYDIDVENTAK